MASKRKSEDEVESPKKPKSEGLFAGCNFHLHPAALSKVRRSIFEKQIKLNCGTLVEDLNGSDHDSVTVLLEDSLTDRDKMVKVAEKTAEKHRQRPKIEFVGLSWISACLEEAAIVPKDKFVVQLEDREAEMPTKVSGKGGEVSKYDGNPSSRIERNKHKFVCARSSENPSSTNLNKHITDELEKLSAAYKSSNDTWRAFGYQKAISALKNHPRRVESREEASAIPNVGSKMADKIMEIIEEGSLRKVHEVCDGERMKTLDLFGRVWGAGPATAERWYEQGLRTLDDLREKADLSRHQKVGLKHFSDLDERMSREECSKILKVVEDAATNLQPGLEVVGCGSYRRGKETCGDLDVLITHSDESVLEGLFERILNKLRESGFLTDDLTVQRDGRQRKYLGVCKLPEPDSKHRRLDIIVVPPDERACALLYFTGSAHFNRSMRLLATKMGMSLSEHALVSEVARGRDREKLNEGKVMATPDEKSVFDILGLPYREPRERNH